MTGMLKTINCWAVFGHLVWDIWEPFVKKAEINKWSSRCPWQRKKQKLDFEGGKIHSISRFWSLNNREAVGCVLWRIGVWTSIRSIRCSFPMPAGGGGTNWEIKTGKRRTNSDSQIIRRKNEERVFFSSFLFVCPIFEIGFFFLFLHFWLMMVAMFLEKEKEKQKQKQTLFKDLWRQKIDTKSYIFERDI